MQEIEIFGTLGPSSHNEDTLTQLFELGMTGMRLNLSHCNLWDRKDWIENFHKAAKKVNIEANLLIDLKGAELRTPSYDDIEYLPIGSTITFSKRFYPKEITTNLEVDDILLIDDGKLELLVTDIMPEFFSCKTLKAGYLLDHKNIAIKGKNVIQSCINQLDIENLKRAKEFGVKSIMMPFTQNKEDLIQLKKELQKLDLMDLKIYAKIENMSGVEHLEEIIPYCNVIVIARGDLGTNIGLTKLPIIQHHIETICHKYNKPYMVVTEMLATMMEHPTPTRPEVNDIFHAIYNGANSIMLTGETASGKYPVEAMNVFCEVVKETKKYMNK